MDQVNQDKGWFAKANRLFYQTSLAFQVWLIIWFGSWQLGKLTEIPLLGFICVIAAPQNCVFSAILAIWGITLVCLELRQKKPVLALATVTGSCFFEFLVSVDVWGWFLKSLPVC